MGMGMVFEVRKYYLIKTFHSIQNPDITIFTIYIIITIDHTSKCNYTPPPPPAPPVIFTSRMFPNPLADRSTIPEMFCTDPTQTFGPRNLSDKSPPMCGESVGPTGVGGANAGEINCIFDRNNNGLIQMYSKRNKGAIADRIRL